MIYIFETTEKIEKCSDCPCCQDNYAGAQCWCSVLDNAPDVYNSDKLPNCPLKEFPNIPTENLASVIQSIGEALIASANNLRGVSEKYDAH